MPVLLEVTQIQADAVPAELPDLATSSYYIKKRGNSLIITIHNIGCAPSGPFAVSVLSPNGHEISTKQVDSLPAATDFVPKTTNVTFSNLPNYARYQIQIDREDKVWEIFEENNSVTFEVIMENNYEVTK